MSVSSAGSGARRPFIGDVSLTTATSRSIVAAPSSVSMSSQQRKRPLLRSKAKTHESESLTSKTRSSTTSRSVESKLKRKPSRYFGEMTFFYDDVPSLDDLSSDKLTPPILSEWIRAKGESFGSVYLVNTISIFGSLKK